MQKNEVVPDSKLQLNGRAYIVPTLTIFNVVGRDAAEPVPRQSSRDVRY